MLVALDLVAGRGSDADLAAWLGSHEVAAQATGRLTGFVLQLLAAHRGEPVERTLEFVRRSVEQA